MLESAIGAKLCVALAMLDNFTYPADIFPSRRFYAQDLARPELELVRGPDGAPHVTANQVPGIAGEPDPVLLEKCCVQRAEVSPR
jgi:O-succinylbenzoate synthase